MTDKNFKTVIVLAATGFAMYSCNANKNSTSSTSSTSSTQQTAPADTTPISSGRQGKYSGVLPCANCEGIETELTLCGDMTYVLTTKYLGRNDSKTDTVKGKFTLQENKLKLAGIKGNERSSLYKVEENQVRQLDMEGKEITGELAKRYVLIKKGNNEIEDKRWRLIELNGKPVTGAPERNYLIFHSKENSIEARANCNLIRLNYTIKNKMQLTIGPGGIMTRMACIDNQEQEFLETIMKVDNITTNGQTLSLNKGRMAPLIRFELEK
jgi:heat shock protein HslJ